MSLGMILVLLFLAPIILSVISFLWQFVKLAYYITITIGAAVGLVVTVALMPFAWLWDRWDERARRKSGLQPGVFAAAQTQLSMPTPHRSRRKGPGSKVQAPVQAEFGDFAHQFASLLAAKAFCDQWQRENPTGKVNWQLVDETPNNEFIHIDVDDGEEDVPMIDVTPKRRRLGRDHFLLR